MRLSRNLEEKETFRILEDCLELLAAHIAQIALIDTKKAPQLINFMKVWNNPYKEKEALDFEKNSINIIIKKGEGLSYEG